MPYVISDPVAADIFYLINARHPFNDYATIFTREEVCDACNATSLTEVDWTDTRVLDLIRKRHVRAAADHSPNIWPPPWYIIAIAIISLTAFVASFFLPS